MTELTAKSGRRKSRDLYSGLNVMRTESKGDSAKNVQSLAKRGEDLAFPIECKVTGLSAEQSWTGGPFAVTRVAAVAPMQRSSETIGAENFLTSTI